MVEPGPHNPIGDQFDELVAIRWRATSNGKIQKTFTTIIVYPGWQAQIDDAGDLHLQRV